MKNYYQWSKRIDSSKKIYDKVLSGYRVMDFECVT